MHIDPRDFIERFVLPTVDEFSHAPLNERRGFLAAIMVNHIADYATITKDGQRVNRIRSLDDPPELQILKDVADAAKHSVLTSDNRTVKNSGQIERLHEPGFFQAPFGQGVFAEANGVCVHRIGYPPTQLLPVLHAAIAFWKSYLTPQA